jgi:RNA polymerase sigma-70 factor, ECF subfamily
MKKDFGRYSDNELLRLLSTTKEDADQAFAEMYSRYSNRIYAYCLRMTGNSQDARDLFQEVFIKFYNSAKEIKELNNAQGFLLKIARNMCLNFKRNKKLILNIDDYAFCISGKNDEKEYEQNELMSLIAGSLELLEFDQREAFILRQYQGLSYKEISEITGKTAGAIKNRYFRAKEKLKEILQPYMIEMSK